MSTNLLDSKHKVWISFGDILLQDLQRNPQGEVNMSGWKYVQANVISVKSSYGIEIK